MQISLGLSLTTLRANPEESPRSILGNDLLEWWTASASLLSLSGSAVTGWSGVIHGFQLLQGVSASRPVFSSTSFGGAPGVTFDGNDDYLDCTDTALLALLPIGSAIGEVWAIVQQDALIGDTGTKIVAGYGGAASTSRRGIARTIFSGQSRMTTQVGDGVGVIGANVAGDFASRHLVRSRATAAAISAHIDGAGSGDTAAVPATAASRFRAGAISNSSPGNYFKGVMRDIFLTTAVPSANQIAALEAWGLPRRML